MNTRLLLGKKKYILAAIALILVLSVAASFCVWDTTSISNLAMNGGVAHLVPYKLAADNNGNKIADVGDIVTFGNYYQSAEATAKDPIKAPIRWIVVHNEGYELTLLAESIMTFGNFWNRHYYNGIKWITEDASFTDDYQNYSVSTLDKWLNADYSPRHDQGTAFTANAEKLGMRGFLNEAFTASEQKYLIDRTIAGIHGMAKGAGNTVVSPYGQITRKVWVPSWSEIFGTTITPVGTKTIDGSPSKQFSYFNGVAYGSGNPKIVGYATAFASTPGESNYTTDKDTSDKQNSQSRAVWWWLRSPAPSNYDRALVVDYDLPYIDAGTYGASSSRGGVRPAISIPA